MMWPQSHTAANLLVSHLEVTARRSADFLENNRFARCACYLMSAWANLIPSYLSTLMMPMSFRHPEYVTV